MNDVDQFIEKLQRTNEITIHPNAGEIRVIQENRTLVNIADGLARAIHDYQTRGAYQNSPEYHKCRGWITTAYTHQTVLPGHRIEQLMKEKDSKIAELEQRIQLSQNDYDELSKQHQKTCDDNINYQGKLDQLREDYDKLIKALTQEGSVIQ